jgi:uncharacterized glyoxalase superfamily protein PhnB
VELPTVFPWRTYDDAHAAIAFLETAFGAERHAEIPKAMPAFRHVPTVRDRLAALELRLPLLDERREPLVGVL